MKLSTNTNYAQWSTSWEWYISKSQKVCTLRQANSVYNLPSIKHAIKWMHAVCGYPVKTTWVKAVKAGNFVGWPLLTTKNINKNYPKTDETPKEHMNQQRKNVRSTKKRSRNATRRQHCAEKWSRTFTFARTTRARRPSPIKPANTPRDPSAATNTSWS